MHPRNVACLKSAGIDCCVLANNHTLDWSIPGLEETLESLAAAGIRTAGAGRDLTEATAPAMMEQRAGGRVLVLAMRTATSGIPPEWAAGAERAGVRFLQGLTRRIVRSLGEEIRAVRGPRDVVVASIHWGPNWGFEVPDEQREFAHRLIEDAGVDVVHGHSSHHAKGIEVHQGRPILYGCGDFLNDYEGISGTEEYRDDLVLMYFVTLNVAGLVRMRMVPLQLRRFRLQPASESDVTWLREKLDRESAAFGTRVQSGSDGSLEVAWG